MKIMKRVLSLVVVLVVLLSISVSAASYQSYVYDSNGFYYSAPDAFNFNKSIDFAKIKDNKGKSIGALSGASDIYVSEEKEIFISDTENQRVIVLNSDFTFNRIISKFKNTILDQNNKKQVVDDNLYAPRSVFIRKEFVESLGKEIDVIYICDQTGAKEYNTDYEIASYKVSTNNRKYSTINEENSGRVLKFNVETGELIDVIVGINSSVLPKDFIFQPRNIVVDKAGRIFVLSHSFSMGIIELSESGEFVQCMGAPAVTFNVVDLIWRRFSTKTQIEGMDKFAPTEYSGIDIDKDGFLYVTNSTFDDRNQAKNVEALSKLNAKGKNVLRTVDYKPYGDINATWTGTFKGPSRLTDVKTLDYGMYAILDRLRGRVFFYNMDGINLFSFGTVPDSPDKDNKYFVEGNLVYPESIEWIDGKCLVLDSSLNKVVVYNKTQYADLIFKASELRFQDKYDEEVLVWQEVLKKNYNSAAAKQSIGKVYYRSGEWETAMNYFKEIVDQENYSKAYKYQRQDLIEKYFSTAVLLIVILLILANILKRLAKKYLPPVQEKSLIGQLKFSLTVIFRPLHSGWIIVRENCASVLSATIILIVASLMSLIQARYTGFIFDPNAAYVNIFLELAKIVVPLMLFCVCNWCVTSLLNGEGNFRAIYISAAYSLTPIILLYPFAIILSNIMVAEEGDFYTVFVSLALAWVLMLIIAGNMRIHDFSISGAVVELVITIVVMLLVIFLAVLFFALCQQMVEFVSDIIQELSLRS